MAGSISLYAGLRQSYARIYKTQPNVRTVIDFIARNIAQLGVHVFRRVSDTDRVRLVDHDLARTIGKPNSSTTRYRLIESTMIDLGIYFAAFWLKLRIAGQPLQLVRLPACMLRVEGDLLPTSYVVTSANGEEQRFAPSEIVHFRGANPEDPLNGLSPMETLRRILAEQAAAGDYRANLWKNFGRFEAVIERPKDAPRWTPEQVDKFRAQLREKYTGQGAGGIPVLTDGMTMKETSFSAKDSQYNESLKLGREICAAAYHIPLPMVGILDHATFSNIREQHSNLYQDCLGPWLVQLEEDIELQLLPDYDDTRGVYVEFNIAEKMKGSFEEQASSLSALTGGAPVMTQNEARARLNLPRKDDPAADELPKPLNFGNAGGDPNAPGPPPKPGAIDASAFSVALRGFFARQSQHLLKLAPEDRSGAIDARRWTSELARDLAPLFAQAGLSVEDANIAGWRVSAAINGETIGMLSAQRHEHAFTAVRAEALAARVVRELAGVV